MVKIVLVLLYLYGGELRLEQHPTASIEDCEKKGNARIEEQMKNPKFEAGLFADCVPILVEEAKAK